MRLRTGCWWATSNTSSQSSCPQQCWWPSVPLMSTLPSHVAFCVVVAERLIFEPTENVCNFCCKINTCSLHFFLIYFLVAYSASTNFVVSVEFWHYDSRFDRSRLLYYHVAWPLLTCLLKWVRTFSFLSADKLNLTLLSSTAVLMCLEVYSTEVYSMSTHTSLGLEVRVC